MIYVRSMGKEDYYCEANPGGTRSGGGMNLKSIAPQWICSDE
jgi:hypothetical protein